MVKFKNIFITVIMLVIIVVGCAPVAYIPINETQRVVGPAFNTSGIRTIAVLNFQNRSDVRNAGSYVRDRFESNLLKVGRFSIVERYEINKILDELKLHQTGLISDRTIKEVGNFLGADVLVVGEVFGNTGDGTTNYGISIKVLDVETARIRFKDKLDLGGNKRQLAGWVLSSRSRTMEKFTDYLTEIMAQKFVRHYEIKISDWERLASSSNTRDAVFIITMTGVLFGSIGGIYGSLPDNTFLQNAGLSLAIIAPSWYLFDWLWYLAFKP